MDTGPPAPPRPAGNGWWPFPWPRRRDDPEEEDGGDAAAVLPPVLFIPGIGGSILDAVRNDNSSKRERIWVRLFNADHEFRGKLWSKYDPEKGKTVSLDPLSHIEVPQGNHGLFAVDVLDPDLRVSMDMVTYFHQMLAEMRTWGLKDGETLFGFGYDFRQSNRLPETMEALKARLAHIHERTGKKVCIVSHSMGGLLVKSFLALHPAEFEAHVAKWIAIASPFRGAPGFIMDTLLTGVDFIKGWQRSLFIAKWSMHQLLVECPSVYELMAEYEFPWAEVPELRIVKPVDGANKATGATEVEVESFASPQRVIRFLEEALQDNSVKVGKETVPLPLCRAIIEWAAETRRIWHRARIPASVDFYSIYGTGLDTPYHTCYGSAKRPITELQEVLHTEAEFDYVEGDGTVPVESAKADGMDAIFRVGVPGEHRALLRDARVFRLCKAFLEVGDPDPLYDPTTDYVLIPPRAEVEQEMAAEGAGQEEVEGAVQVLVECTDIRVEVTKHVASGSDRQGAAAISTKDFHWSVHVHRE